MMMSTPFAFDIVESSMRTVVDGDDIRVAFYECVVLLLFVCVL